MVDLRILLDHLLFQSVSSLCLLPIYPSFLRSCGDLDPLSTGFHLFNTLPDADSPTIPKWSAKFHTANLHNVTEHHHFLGWCPFPVIIDNNSKLKFSSWINESKNVARSWWRLRILGKGEHLRSFYSSHLGIDNRVCYVIICPFFWGELGSKSTF